MAEVKEQMKQETEILVNKIIEQSKDIEGFKKIVQKTFLLPNSIIAIFQKYGYEYKIYQQDDFPQVTVIIELGGFEKGEFSVTYSYHLYFSKLALVCKDYFRYEVENRDPDNMMGGCFVSDEYSPMTIQHYNFYDELCKAFTNEKYLLLAYRDLEEVLCDLSFKDDSMKFFNEQPNVDLIFFHDILS